MAAPIKKLTIRGFKSIRALEDFELRPLNILIGANGAGKSNFVDFFTMLREMVEQHLQPYVRTHGGADAHLFLGPKVTQEIVGEFHFPPNSYGFTLQRTVGNELFFAKESTGFKAVFGDTGSILGTGHLEAKLKDCKDNPGRTARHGVEYHVHKAVSSWTVYHFHDTSNTAAVRREGSARDHERLREDAGNLAAFLLELRDAKSPPSAFQLRNASPVAYGLIRDTVRLVAPFFDDFKLRPRSNGQDEVVFLEWTQKGSDYPFHPSQLSDGTLRFICMATALLQPRPPATMLFDEPELGLHPYALNVLAGLLKQAASRTQVIVSTQSAPLLDYFEPEDVIVVDRKDGASSFSRLDKTQLTEWLDQYSLGELWQKNVFDGGPAHE